MAWREDVDFGNVRARTLEVAGGVTGDVTGAITPTGYTVAGLPAAADSTGMVVYCSNGASGDPCLAFSNGTNWLQIAIGTAVAAA
jgi:hypothetical protein